MPNNKSTDLWVNLNLAELAKRGSDYVAERVAFYQDMEGDPVTAKFRAAVIVSEGEIEVDPNAVVSTSDEGAYVMCWQWVANEQVGIRSDYEEDGDAE